MQVIERLGKQDPSQGVLPGVPLSRLFVQPMSSSFVQFVREFARLGLTRSVGGVLALALSRELTPVVTAIILAGRVGSAFAAELGTMQVCSAGNTRLKTPFLRSTDSSQKYQGPSASAGHNEERRVCDLARPL